jgi:hypothetical protein
VLATTLLVLANAFLVLASSLRMLANAPTRDNKFIKNVSKTQCMSRKPMGHGHFVCRETKPCGTQPVHKGLSNNILYVYIYMYIWPYGSSGAGVKQTYLVSLSCTTFHKTKCNFVCSSCLDCFVEYGSSNDYKQ